MSAKPKPKQDLKISARSSKLLADFDVAAQTLGWEKDQGWSETSRRLAEEQHEAAHLALVRRIAHLEA